MSGLRKTGDEGNWKKVLGAVKVLPTAQLQVHHDPLYLWSCHVTPLLMEEELWAQIDWQRAVRSQHHMYQALLQKLKKLCPVWKRGFRIFGKRNQMLACKACHYTLYSLSLIFQCCTCLLIFVRNWTTKTKKHHEVSNYYYHKTDRSVVKLSGLLLQEAADTTANKTNLCN